MAPLVSVVLPIFKPGPFFNAAVESIVSQTLRDFELIIVDDGTPDPDGVLDLCPKDKRIVHIRSDCNRGVAAAINTGISAARGEFIARMDGDDIAHHERLERQVRFLDSRPDLVGLGSSYIRIDRDGRRLQQSRRQRGALVTKWVGLTRCAILDPTLLVRRAFLHTHSLYYNPTYKRAQDLDFQWRAMQHGRFVVSSDCLLYYRIAPNSQTFANYAATVEEHITICNGHWRRLMGLNTEEADALGCLLRCYLLGECGSAENLGKACEALVNLVHRFLEQHPSAHEEHRQVCGEAMAFCFAALLRSGRIADIARAAALFRLANIARNMIPMMRIGGREIADRVLGRLMRPFHVAV